MTRFSFIVPVHKVQGYLSQCLDSILEQSYRDFELIAVNDCSPDHSGDILALYAARDHRVRVVNLDTNVGQGPARNIALDIAVGEYVWFVDGDDWLNPGSLRAVADRIDATGADVVLVGWVRAYWDGRVNPGTATRILPAAPETFTLTEFPRVVDVLHVPWNKIVRRDLLTGIEFRFESGWYEDVSFTYPVLSVAQRITALDRVCVNYRQRRIGAATRTYGDGHFAFFPHWERAFELVDRWAPNPAALRPILFRRMVWHMLMVLGNGDRVPPSARRSFFKKMHEHYRTYVPEGGYPVPGGVQGLRHRLVKHNAFLVYLVLQRVHRVLKRGYEVARKARRVARPALRSVRDRMLRGYYHLQRWLPIDENLAVYSAYWHRGYACNPAAVYAAARELAPGVRGVWAVNRGRVADLPADVEHVVSGSLAYYRALARAKYLVNNVNWPNWATKRRGSVHVMTHHGTPLKQMGLDQLSHPVGATDKNFVAQLRRADRWDYSVTSNAHTTIAWERAYPCRYETLEVGYPRNDRLVKAKPLEMAEVRAKLGIEPGQTVVLYAPTHREWHPAGTLVLDPEDLAAQLGPQHVVLVRAHYFNVGTGRAAVEGAGRLLDVSAYPVVEDLYLAADVLVTDYSSVMFDYAVLDRPMV
ncbi:MAG TPA: bifunctional glycosyltransferase family 2 protein/CDP-glycerol:glycerophosphate glycerophosphotransferase, partial [Actinoplanes sp.]|nr:bifunctional glycosyltransferase family 2 protein/CDP-glycerol:glycerophosphate glycerophosphotransferase [Actinoplanes sp.]